MTDFIQVSTTTGKKADAQLIARVLLENRLAGCVQIVGPIESFYWWEGKLETAEEWLCIIKSEDRLLAELEQTIKTTHPYETPEIVVTRIVAGSTEYLAWLNKELKGPNGTNS